MSLFEAELQIRDTVVLTPEQLREDIDHPENVRVKLNDSVAVAPIDIGCLAFAIRKMDQDTWTEAFDATPVFLGSFRRERVHMLNSICDHICIGKYSDATRKLKIRGFRHLVNECDRNGLHDFMLSPEKCRQAYQQLSAEWRHQSTVNSDLSANAASTLQSNFILLTRLCFDKAEAALILEQVNRIKYKKNTVKPPTEAHFSSYIKTVIALATGLKQFVVEQKNFPIRLKMPEYEAFVFHSQGGNVKTPFTSKHHSIYNFKEGRLATFDEWKDSVKQPHPSQYARALSNFSEANDNKRHERRIDFATLSMQAYMKIFVLLTAAHPSEVVQLEFSEEQEYERNAFKNDFRAIKLRAKGREVSYSLGNYYGHLLFKEYLELRKWILNGDSCKYLFFSVKSNEHVDKLAFSQININRSYYRFISRIREVYVASDFADITSCPTRKYKNLILNELQVSLETRSSVLNHTQETNLSHYTDTTPDRQAAEFQAHWDAMKQARKHVDLMGKHNKKISVGHCTEIDNPESEIANPPISPDCKTQYGCLFCSKYSCHADEEDVHKLYSVLGVIDMIRDQSTDFAHAEKMFQTLSIRINEILKAVSEKSDEHRSMVERIQKKVMVSGVMTLFWERRLDQYERMGVITIG